jgi:hypothetical protein
MLILAAMDGLKAIGWERRTARWHASVTSREGFETATNV